MNDPGGLHRQIAQYEAIVKSHEDGATKQVEDIWSSTQPGIDAAREIIRRQEALIAQTEAEREARKRDIFSHASEVTAHTRSLLGDAKHQLSAVSAPILRLPNECIAEIMQYFNVTNHPVVLLLVSKKWNAIATDTPRLWSKIAITHGLDCRRILRLGGAHICGSLEHLSSVLSLAKYSPLDIELCTRSQSATQQIPMPSGSSTTEVSDCDKYWPNAALNLIGADGRSPRWRSLYITAWYGRDEVPFKAIKGPFSNLRLLYISPFDDECRWAYIPLVAAIVQGSPRLSTVHMDRSSHSSVSIIQGIDGWENQRFWRNIKYYHSLNRCEDLSVLSQASRLTELSLSSWRDIPRSQPVSLPCLRILRLSHSPLQLLDKLRFPILEILFLGYGVSIGVVNPGTIPVPSVRSIISNDCSDVRIFQRFSAPIIRHLHISCLDYDDRTAQSNAWRKTFSETFDGSQFMPKPISLHLELPVTESQLLSALYLLPQIEELRISLERPLGSKFWSALVPRGAGGRRKAKQYCPKLRILVVEPRLWIYGNAPELTKAQTLELGVRMATAREQEGQTLTHLLFRWFDRSTDEVLGSFSTLPLHPSRGIYPYYHYHNCKNRFCRSFSSYDCLVGD